MTPLLRAGLVAIVLATPRSAVQAQSVPTPAGAFGIGWSPAAVDAAVKLAFVGYDTEARDDSAPSAVTMTS